MKQYIGTKIVKAEPMNRAAYNVFRNWKLPADENGEDEGYLVEYLDSGKPNVLTHEGYVSWSPKEQFDNAYRENGTPQQRVVIEESELRTKVEKLLSFVSKPQPSFICDTEWARLNSQLTHMFSYLTVINDRIANF
jgi:hypothetical protein